MLDFSKQTHFARPQLATQLAQALLGRIAFSDAPNGLFLAAPRRIGKSAFLQQDLRPALQAEGAVVVYLDLWVNQDKDPALVIAQAIGAELLKHLGVVSRTALAIGLESISLGDVLKMDTRKIGQPDGVTLHDALALLIEKSGKPVAVIIDEAQHSLTSKAGDSTMMALKSARDTINNSGGNKLMLVMSGSDRDKLMRLVNTTSAAFYGSQIQKMPPLGEDYVDATAIQIEAAYPAIKPVDRKKLNEAFLLLGSRPQFLASAITSGLSPFEFNDVRIEDAVLQIAQEQVAADREQMEADFLGLKDIEQLVVWRMLETGPKFRPYDADALDFYTKKSGQTVSAQQVQAALVTLRGRNPSIIWKSERGDYALDNVQMRDWYLQLVAAGSWPPGTSTPAQDKPEDSNSADR